jgi:hypothetical protein
VLYHLSYCGDRGWLQKGPTGALASAGVGDSGIAGKIQALVSILPGQSGEKSDDRGLNCWICPEAFRIGFGRLLG